MKKKLRKSNDKKICGVCAGIAEYFNIDPVIVRLLWGICIIASFGTGILAYILCAFILPDAIEEENINNMKDAKYDSTHTSEN